MLLPLLVAAALAAEVPVGAPPPIPSYVLDGMIFDGSHFVLAWNAGQNFGRTLLADDGTQLHGVAADYGESAAFAASGHGYLSVAVHGGNAYATRLNANGQAIDTAPFLAAAGASAMALRWDGHRYVLLWRGDHRLALSFVGDDGSVSDGGTVANDCDGFALAARDGVSIAAWSFGGTVYSRIIGGDAVPIGSGVVADVAPGNEGFLAVAIDGGTIAARHLDAAGRPDLSYTIPASARVARATRERYTYAIVWGEGNDVRGARVDPFTGAINGPFLAAAAEKPVDGVAAASTVARTLIGYSTTLGGIFSKPLDDTGAGKPMPGHLAAQSNVHAAPGVVAWQQETAAGSDIHAGDRVLAGGAQLHLEDVAAGPGVTLVLWSDAQGLWSMRLPDDAAPRLISSDGGSARAVWDGSDFAIVRTNGAVARSADRTLLASDGKATIVTGDARVAATVTLASDARSIGAASDGNGFLAVWNSTAEQIVAQAISADGALTGARIVVDATPARKGSPHVRWNGIEWLVTWPEIVDAGTFGFASIVLGRGAKTIVARAPLLPGASTPFLDDWSEAGGSLFYIRDDAPQGMNPAARLFTQRVQPARRRTVTSSAAPPG